MMSERRHLILVSPCSSDDYHRVVPFGPRQFKTERMDNQHHRIHKRDPDILLIEKFAKYERNGQDDDYRQRMILNGLGFAVTVVLIAFGVWLADNINDRGPPHSAGIQIWHSVQ